MADIIVSSDVDTFMQSANQSAMRTNVGYGTIVTQNSNNVNITGGSIIGITDLAVADGGTGSSTASGARTNLEVYSDSEVDAKVATKETAGGVKLDGVNGLIQLASNAGSAAPFLQKNNVLTYTWNGNAKQETLRQIVYSKSYSDTSEQGGLAIQLIENTTKLQVLLRQDSSFSGHYAIDWNNAIDGNWHSFAVVLDYTGATPSITLYRDGISFGAGNVSLGATGSFDDTLAVYVKIGKSASNNLYQAAINNFRIFNRALSAAEVADLYETGVVAVADRWGNPTLLYESDFSANDDGWTEGGGTSTFNQTIDGKTGCYVFTVDGTTGLKQAYKSILGTVNKNGRLKCQLYIPNTNTVVDQVRVEASGKFVQLVTTIGSWVDISIEDTFPTFPQLYFVLRDGGSTTIAGNSTDYIAIRAIEVEQIGAIADLPLDEGIGYQFHDRSSNHFDALASLTGVTHLVPKANGKVRVKAANASSAMYMLRADSILPENSIVSNVLSEQCYVDLTNSAQTLNDYRIRLNPSGSDLQIQRSDGSNHQTLGTVTAPSSLSDVDVQINYKQIAQ